MEWISVKDRLPVEGQEVIVFINRKDRSWVVAGMYTKSNRFHWSTYKGNNCYTRYVTHWMPLPHGPQE